MTKSTKEEILPGVKLNTLYVDKFKTNLIKIYYQRPLIQEESTLNGLLPMVLQRGTEGFQSSLKLTKELENLYGAYLNSSVLKKGERHIIDFTLGTVDFRFVEDTNLLNESLQLLNEVINKPLLEKGGFKREFVKQEKNNLEKRIKARLNDKSRYAVERCVEEMCSNENFRLYELGQIQDLATIDENNLYEYYLKVLETSPIEILVVGNLQHETVKGAILEKIKFNRGTIVDIPREEILINPKEVKKVKEKMEIAQGKLTLGYRTNIPYEDSTYPAVMVYTNLLGGGPHSKLFLKVREERSLCYYIYSRMEKFKSLMLISCGIEVDKYDEVVNVILQQLEEINRGNITDEEMENTKKAMINSVKSIGDHDNAIADFYYGQAITKQFITPEELIKQIENVKKEEVAAVGEKIKLDTIYFLQNQQ